MENPWSTQRGINMSCFLGVCRLAWISCVVCWAGGLVFSAPCFTGTRCPGPCSRCLLPSGLLVRVVTRCGVSFTHYVSGDNLWELVLLLLWGPDCTEVVSFGCGAEPDIISLLLLLFRLKFIDTYFMCTNVCAPHACLTPVESRRRCPISWN